ncbi:polysaccharide biosynthesis tyrosine autokinase [Planktothrix agardhii 1806]|uniref:non-specific protein-tyrosine kinase n=1 Tax=Planktothrix agardhii (strain NIVA-CYA 126/8) TaxID=388467 RepID=A0A073CCG7_PLAA1|nr:polysaccharide biosynthesis tyrosine autokinase [Planktothrix agardhii]KEI66024.1 EpsB [Planktothrix agardhii NIVA-CYA 126/8]MCF3573168.1 polysaccharide biosynthesis tyrosine autokinase [Planktothrix agardhii 1805]MCF3583762.1 polysaccharide biosynthesis tyrosine autokinase [Planktothrix agardhii 1803]MCF3604102.1 polysaccharide biosynthesis tyrosine autokinase [Planktothrix agardhii 1804]MCF3618516.1 polysaccharide biosynthesis tyrosine autokinase [Planktothrix agardhii 1806]
MKNKKLSQLSVDKNTRKTLHPSGEILYYDPDLYPGYDEEKSNFFQVLWKQAIAVLGVTTAVTAGVYLWTINQTPEYKGSFQILVETNPQTSPPQPSENEGSLDSNSEKNSDLDYYSQLEILQSPKLMSGILKGIQTRYPEVTYDSLLNQKTGQTFWGNDNLAIKPLKQTRIFEVSYQDSEPQKVQFVLEKIAEGYLKYSHPKDVKDQQKEQQLKLIQAQIATLEKKLPQIKQGIEKLQQQYNFIDPKLQTEYLFKQKSELQAQKLEAQSQLVEQESQYQYLQKQLGLKPEQALLASALTQSPQYQGLLQELLKLETQIAIESARFKGTAPQIQALLDQRSQILPLLEKEAKNVLGANTNQVDPNIIRFQDSIRMGLIQQLILVANNIEMLKVRNQVLEKATQQLNQYSQVFPEVLGRYNDLQQQLKNTTNQLTELNNKSQEMQLQVVPKVKSEPWELIAPPRIPSNTNGELITVSPNVPLNLALGGLAGLFLGVITAQILERFNNVYRTTHEVTDRISLPLLGVIPASNEALILPGSVAPIIDISDLTYPACSPFQEAFRALNTNLRLLNPEGSVRSCVITSATPADGKSTIAMNLAQGAAAMGQRVLLVDADLRCPRIHTLLEITNQLGLTNILTQKLDFKTVIKQVNSEANLSVLTAGQFYPDPTRLLSSKPMQELMKQLQESYDLIIYDTAPILGLADANLLAPHTDGLMMVVGLGKTDREAFSLALREINTAGVPVLGMVANGDKQETHYYRDY